MSGTVSSARAPRRVESPDSIQARASPASPAIKFLKTQFTEPAMTLGCDTLSPGSAERARQLVTRRGSLSGHRYTQVQVTRLPFESLTEA
jgi:hypothetical protein